MRCFVCIRFVWVFFEERVVHGACMYSAKKPPPCTVCLYGEEHWNQNVCLFVTWLGLGLNFGT